MNDLGFKKKLAGQTINNIYVIEKSDDRRNGATHWNCKCLLCGSYFTVDGRHLTKEKPQFSCGCVKSRGEFQIASILNLHSIRFKRQYRFEQLPNRYFDFAIFDKNDNLTSLIEYDGEQHFNKNSKYYSDEMIQHDKEKNSFCLKSDIPLYRIPYWDLSKLDTLENIFNSNYLIKDKGMIS